MFDHIALHFFWLDFPLTSVFFFFSSFVGCCLPGAAFGLTFILIFVSCSNTKPRYWHQLNEHVYGLAIL